MQTFCIGQNLDHNWEGNDYGSLPRPKSWIAEEEVSKKCQTVAAESSVHSEAVLANGGRCISWLWGLSYIMMSKVVIGYCWQITHDCRVHNCHLYQRLSNKICQQSDVHSTGWGIRSGTIFCWHWVDHFRCLPNYAWAAINLAEWALHLGTRAELWNSCQLSTKHSARVAHSTPTAPPMFPEMNHKCTNNPSINANVCIRV